QTFPQKQTPCALRHTRRFFVAFFTQGDFSPPPHYRALRQLSAGSAPNSPGRREPPRVGGGALPHQGPPRGRTPSGPASRGGGTPPAGTTAPAAPAGR